MKLTLFQNPILFQSAFVVARFAADGPTIDFFKLAILFGSISLSIIGLFMAGAMFWPEQVEPYKKQIGTVIMGVVLVTLVSSIMAVLESSGGS